MSVLLLGAGKGVDDSASPYNIVSITDSSGFCLITTEAPHGLVGVTEISITGSSLPEYDTNHVVTTIVDPYSFVTDQPYASDATGGVWIII